MSTSNTSPPRPPRRKSSVDSLPGSDEAGKPAPAIVRSLGEDNILYKGRLLYPESGPSRFARRLVDAAPREPARLYLVASPGLWYGVRELLASIDDASALLCVETDPALARLAKGSLAADLASEARLAFVEGRDYDEVLAAAEGLGSYRRVLLVRLSGGAAFDESGYARLAKALDDDSVAAWRNKASLLVLGRLWARNIFRNLARLDSIRPLPGSDGE